MNTDSVSDNSGEHLPSVRRNHTLVAFWVAEAFVLGGFIALLLVYRILGKQLDIYAAGGYMDAASTILDVMDDLLAYLVPFGALSLLLGLITVTVWIWFAAGSR